MRRVTAAVSKYTKVNDNEYASDFERYYKTISDHIPIIMDIELR